GLSMATTMKPFAVFLVFLTATLASAQTSAELLDQAAAALAAGKLDDALSLASRAIEKDPNNAEASQLRGIVHFKLGKVDASIRDFDRYIELRPERKVSHWQRGISYYYAGRFDDGRKQFEGYQDFDSNDVENA